MITINLILAVMLLVFLRIMLMWGVQWISLSAYADATRIYDEEITEEQNRRENRSWPFMFAFQSIGILVYVYFGLIKFDEFTWWSVPFIILLHIFLIEPIYYGYHYLLHKNFFYENYHVYHHLSIVVEPRTAVSFTFTESLSYTLLFSIPFLILSWFDMFSYQILFGYTLLFDVANYIGHANYEFFPRWYINSRLKWLFYTPTFHSAHHKFFTKNYALFMPIWDKLFNKVEKKTDEIFLQALNKKNKR